MPADDIVRLEQDIRRLDDEATHYRHDLRSEIQRLYIEMVEIKAAMNPLLPLQIEVAQLKQARVQAQAGAAVISWLWKGATALILLGLGAVAERWSR